jgi:hypothetical protein
MENEIREEQQSTDFNLTKKDEVSLFSVNIKFTAVIITSTIFMFLVGFYGMQMVKKPQVKIVTEVSKEDQQTLIPKNLEIIKNPIFANWSANVRGRLTKRSETSFVLQPIKESYLPNGKLVQEDLKNEKATTIIYLPNKTKFFKTEIQNGKILKNEINYNTLSEGVIVRGNVNISYQNNSYSLIGNSLNIN